ncbi:hypothetical protein OSB04_013143 [Centaurea solstitialis]|uniref:F-box domain-containing protein n=1 Tax=Centaurea solstitialis TaxID=347529 RepID=A0AA38WQG0_9ASTR|nr:hypothetical protein OSB04_013143 [Centaurea solstitialis]
MAVELLPDEVIVEILSILPAESLLRCRLVCKWWLTLISSSKFKLMHLHNFNQLNPRYFVGRLDYFASEEWFCVHLDDEAFSFDDSTQIEFPFDRSRGFGYDNISDDYKVVSLIYDASSLSTRPKVEVYSVKTGIWREVMFPDNVLCYCTFPMWLQVFFNGVVHWTAFDLTPSFSIMTFDITTELFEQIQFPEFLTEKYLRVFVAGESLAAVQDVTLDRVDSGSTYRVWVMKEYKNPASWTMLYHVKNADVNLREPLRLRNNGDMIAELKNRDMIMFNHNEGSYVNVFGDSVEEGFDCRTYVDRFQESLALLDVGDSVPNEEAMEALMMIEKQGMRL